MGPADEHKHSCFQVQLLPSACVVLPSAQMVLWYWAGSSMIVTLHCLEHVAQATMTTKRVVVRDFNIAAGAKQDAIGLQFSPGPHQAPFQEELHLLS